MKQIVVPGDKLEGKVDSYVFTDAGNTYSMVLGVFDKGDGVGKLDPLTGKYFPQVDDFVVGVISEIKKGGYVVDINSPYDAFLMSRRIYDEKDIILARVNNVSEVRSVSLTYDKKLFDGEIMEVSPVKVPRVIGKKNSMVDMIKEKTKAEIVVGQNGRIWLKGGDISKAREAIDKIEKEAHTDGLTERINEFLNKVI